MADRHAIRLPRDAYERLAREAERRRTTPDDLAASLVDDALRTSGGDFEHALASLARVRASIPEGIDGLGLARAARDELERRPA
jgi:hypothetical protein